MKNIFIITLISALSLSCVHRNTTLDAVIDTNKVITVMDTLRVDSIIIDTTKK